MGHLALQFLPKCRQNVKPDPNGKRSSKSSLFFLLILEKNASRLASSGQSKGGVKGHTPWVQLGEVGLYFSVNKVSSKRQFDSINLFRWLSKIIS